MYFFSFLKGIKKQTIVQAEESTTDTDGLEYEVLEDAYTETLDLDSQSQTKSPNSIQNAKGFVDTRLESINTKKIELENEASSPYTETSIYVKESLAKSNVKIERSKTIKGLVTDLEIKENDVINHSEQDEIILTYSSDLDVVEIIQKNVEQTKLGFAGNYIYIDSNISNIHKKRDGGLLEHKYHKDYLSNDIMESETIQIDLSYKGKLDIKEIAHNIDKFIIETRKYDKNMNVNYICSPVRDFYEYISKKISNFKGTPEIPTEKIKIMLILFGWDFQKLGEFFMNVDDRENKKYLETVIFTNLSFKNSESKCRGNTGECSTISVYLSCGHEYCKSCYKDYATHSIRDPAQIIVKCKEKECSHVMCYDDLKILVKKTDLRKYIEKVVAEVISLPCGRLKQCPAQSCRVVTTYKSSYELLKCGATIRCKCKTKFCFACLQDPHPMGMCYIMPYWDTLISKFTFKINFFMKHLEDIDNLKEKTFYEHYNECTECINRCYPVNPKEVLDLHFGKNVCKEWTEFFMDSLVNAISNKSFEDIFNCRTSEFNSNNFLESLREYLLLGKQLAEHKKSLAASKGNSTTTALSLYRTSVQNRVCTSIQKTLKIRMYFSILKYLLADNKVNLDSFVLELKNKSQYFLSSAQYSNLGTLSHISIKKMDNKQTELQKTTKSIGKNFNNAYRNTIFKLVQKLDH
ncbi:hypothetical protein BB560_000840 [Smittium megazygosporum]|uniref:RING-type domain-containing protein n=1 Tax=Smittium megazygosporum TaxID=133381 RepID=A0A2T9ZJE9_9FUNG|nr:hypothetical protein BB560_000840 [Smittium megazygosporum]